MTERGGPGNSGDFGTPASMSQNANLTWGKVAVEDLGEEMADVQGEPLPVHASRYTWTPDTDLDLPPGFKLVLKCWDIDGKSRRFFPYESCEKFALEASLTGAAILERLGKLNGPARYSYRMSRLLFQRASGLQDHLMRKFVSAGDLKVTAAARVAGKRDVLPPSIGLDYQQIGEPWPVEELLKQGRELANEHGDKAPDEEQRIRLGLLAAARLCPIDVSVLTEDQARSLVRMGLFGTGPSFEVVNEETKTQVEKRLLSAIDRHMDDDQEAFNLWFFKDADNLIRQVAKQKHDGGQVSRDVVRSVLLDLVFRSYGHVAQTVEVFLRDFAISRQVELAGDELAVFERMYYRQKELGGLPLLMLRDRFPLIREVALQLFVSPQNGELLGVLLQMLRFYSEMVENRRAADRRYKSVSQHKNACGRTANMVESSDNLFVERNNSQFDELVAHILEGRDKSCKCETSPAWNAKVAAQDRTGTITLDVACANCGHLETAIVTEDELRAAKEELADEDEVDQGDDE
jgi:hypothetical protein